MSETVQTPDEGAKIWQEYLQKCCEVGQLVHTIDQIDGQKRQFEKNLEIAQRDVKSIAAKHKEFQQKKLTEQKPENH